MKLSLPQAGSCKCPGGSHKANGSFSLGEWMTVGRASMSSNSKVDGGLGVQSMQWGPTGVGAASPKTLYGDPRFVCNLPGVLTGSRSQISCA